MGRLVSLTATEITLDTPQGQVTVAVDLSTKFIDEAGNPLASTDLKTGDVIAVFGKTNRDDSDAIAVASKYRAVT